MSNLSVSAQDNSHPWAGAKIAIFGDSISDPRTNNGKEKYWWYMQQEIGIIPLVYAVNGKEWNDVLPQSQRLVNDYGNDFDAIMILMGTNDFNHGIPIGAWFKESEALVEAATGEKRSLKTRMHRTPDFDRCTFKGRINIALDSLKRMFPEKQIILMTPLHRGLADYGETNVQPDENYTNSCGDYIDAYVEAIKEAGNIWAVTVIDLNSLSGIFPLHSAQKKYFPLENDKLHPDDPGHKRMADAITAALYAIALWK